MLAGMQCVFIAYPTQSQSRKPACFLYIRLALQTKVEVPGRQHFNDLLLIPQSEPKCGLPLGKALALVLRSWLTHCSTQNKGDHARRSGHIQLLKNGDPDSSGSICNCRMQGKPQHLGAGDLQASLIQNLQKWLGHVVEIVPHMSEAACLGASRGDCTSKCLVAHAS